MTPIVDWCWHPRDWCWRVRPPRDHTIYTTDGHPAIRYRAAHAWLGPLQVTWVKELALG